MSWFSNWMHPERGYENAQEELNKNYQESQGYLNPYNQNGQSAYNGLNGAMNNLLNPEELQNKWAQGYETSPAAKQAIQMAQNYGMDAAESLGLNGSSAALGALQGGASNIAMQDRQQYLNDLMDKYKTGAGIGQNIYGVGANAAGQQSQNANQMGQNAAEMAYGRQNAQGNMFNNLLTSGIGAAGTAAGAALGGPIGGAIANKWITSGGK